MGVYELTPGASIGIDEVGRGALAGPVVVAAAMLKRGVRLADKGWGKLKDSKKLTARQRELWYAHFAEHPGISFAISRVYPRQIEKQNISKAANLAALRAHGKLVAGGAKNGSGYKVFLDGGLFLGTGPPPSNAKTVVKGDEKIKAIAVASIVAKVHRDRFMKKLAKRHPEYGFDAHKGYGTKVHLKAIDVYGPCTVHRLTFLGLKYRM